MGKERLRHDEAECSRSFEVDHQLDIVRYSIGRSAGLAIHGLPTSAMRAVILSWGRRSTALTIEGPQWVDSRGSIAVHRMAGIGAFQPLTL